MKRPLTGLVVVYGTGIWIGSLVRWPVIPLLLLAASLLGIFLLLSSSRFSLPVLISLVLVSGVAVEREAFLPPADNYVTRRLEYRDQNARFRGVIVSDPSMRFELELSHLESDGQWVPTKGKLMVFVNEDRPSDQWRYGDEIECSALLQVPPQARNPGGFNWQKWLAQRGIPFTAAIRKTDACRVLAHNQGNPLTALSLRLRNRFEAALHLGLEDEPDVAGTLAGMVIGARAEIPEETHEQFQRAGVFHVFAINGLHVGLVTGILLLVLRLLRISRRWCGLVAIPLLVLYVFATGAHPGAVRALVMASVWLIGWMLLRPADGLNNLAVAAAVLLVWDPNQLFDGGFVLSFTVVLALVLLAGRVESFLKNLVAPDPLLPEELVPLWRKQMTKIANWGMRLLSCSFVAWVGLLPLMAVYFHLFTPVSVVANLVVVPLLALVIALGIVSVMAHAIWPWLTLTLNNTNFFLLSGMTHAVEWLQKLPGGHVFVKAPPFWVVAAYYTVALLFLYRPKHRYTWAMATPVMVGMTFFCFWPENTAELTVLSLNDGVCVFVNLPGEQHDILMDGGGDWSGKREVIPFLRAQGVDRLDAVVVTRGDKAHVAGLHAVAASIPINKVVSSGVPTRSKFNVEWLKFLRKHQIPVQQVNAGDAWKTGHLKLRVLNPSRAAEAGRSDDNALVLLLEYGPTRVLLLSDAGQTAEPQVLAANVQAQIIVKGRHSRETGCTEALLAAVKPEVVVQCRYPEPELWERLQNHKIQLVRTDEAGAVVIRLTNNGYSLRNYLGTQN